jgi:hypothetical protein
VYGTVQPNHSLCIGKIKFNCTNAYVRQQSGSLMIKRQLCFKIREQEAPTKLISNRDQVEISKKVQSILRTLFVGNTQSEPHQQQQNPAELNDVTKPSKREPTSSSITLVHRNIHGYLHCSTHVSCSIIAMSLV